MESTDVMTLKRILEATVAALVILGGGKSAWNGYIKKTLRTVDQAADVHDTIREMDGINQTVEEIHDTQIRMKDTQEDLKDAVVALSEVQASDRDVTPDTAEFKDRFLDEDDRSSLIEAEEDAEEPDSSESGA